jgi:hypothetical protein
MRHMFYILKKNSVALVRIAKYTDRVTAACRSGFFLNLCCGTLDTAAATGLLYQPRMISEGDCGEIGGMKIGRGNRSTLRKPAPAQLVHHKSHMTRPGFQPGPPRWEASE